MFRTYWTIIIGLLMLMFFYVRRIYYHTQTVSITPILRSIFVIGCAEMFYLLLQTCRIIPSHNLFFRLTGSFINPSNVGMLMSICIPIGFFYAIRQRDKSLKFIWLILTASMFVPIIKFVDRTSLLATLTSILIILFYRMNNRYRRIYAFFCVVTAILGICILYILEKDSADGRLFIWFIAILMIGKRPLLGYGLHGFSAHYMEHQADFFYDNPMSPFSMVADNVSNPFNMFLHTTICFGTIGLIIVLLTVVYLFVRVHSMSSNEKPVILGLAYSLIIWSFFSYPQNVPLMWVVAVIVLIIAVVSGRANRYAKLINTSLVVIIGCCIIMSSMSFYKQLEWVSARSKYDRGEIDLALKQYRIMQSDFYSDGNFLYNYGAILHHCGFYEESSLIFEKCLKYVDDYNVEMILADDYFQMGKKNNAIHCFERAHYMVPVKFLPLYHLMKVYGELGNSDMEREYAEQIIIKPVKVPSPQIDDMKRRAKEIYDL